MHMAAEREGVVLVENRITRLRFPDGDTEYRTTPTLLKVSVQVRSRGCIWAVAALSEGTAVLAALEQTSAHPMVERGPTDEGPMVLEAVPAF